MTGFKLVVAGYFGTAVIGIFSQITEIAKLSSWLEYGALGLLGVTIVGQLYIIVVSQRDQFKRMDGWEKQRHDDSQTLNETLTRLRENCAKKQ